MPRIIHAADIHLDSPLQAVLMPCSARISRPSELDYDPRPLYENH